MLTTEEVTTSTVTPDGIGVSKPDALGQLTQYIYNKYRYSSTGFASGEGGMTYSEAVRTAEVLIRTQLMPGLDNQAIGKAYGIVKAGA